MLNFEHWYWHNGSCRIALRKNVPLSIGLRCFGWNETWLSSWGEHGGLSHVTWHQLCHPSRWGAIHGLCCWRGSIVTRVAGLSSPQLIPMILYIGWWHSICFCVPSWIPDIRANKISVTIQNNPFGPQEIDGQMQVLELHCSQSEATTPVRISGATCHPLISQSHPYHLKAESPDVVIAEAETLPAQSLDEWVESMHMWNIQLIC